MDISLPFTEHLEELRLRVLYSAAGIIAASAVSFFFHGKLLSLIRAPMAGSLIFISPHEAFIVSLRVSVLSGIVLSFPFVAYQLWKFIESGLKPAEKKFVYYYLPSAILLFAAGVAFSFMVVMPAALNFLLGFGGTGISPYISLERYVSFAFGFIVAFGIVFQLPLVMRMLTSLGIVERETFRSGRKYAVVLIFISAALLTPPDIFSQIALALPSLLLYELGLLVCGRARKKYAVEEAA